MDPYSTMLEVPHDKRLAQVTPEIYSKGHCYAASDVLRHQVIVLGQRMTAIQTGIEECVGEPVSIASLFESADLKLRKGRTGSFAVRRLTPDELPQYLDQQRRHFGRVVIVARNPDKWQLAEITAS